MGDPKKPKKKFSTPRHPWEATRITEESKLIKEYGLIRKREIWKSRSLLSKWHTQARKLISLPDEEIKKAEGLLISKLNKLGILKKDAQVDDVLALTERDILERRLQTQLYKQGFTNTIKQARQFIVHQKIMVDNKKITSPAFLVEEGSKVRFIQGFTPKIKEALVLAKTTSSKEIVPKSEALREEVKASADKEPIKQEEVKNGERK